MKKKTFLTLLFVSCYLLFVLSCSLEPPKVQKPEAGDVGYVSLSIAGGGAHGGRTIMPAAMTTGLFDGGYTLVFSADDFTDITVEKTNSNMSTPIPLPVGTWALEITGYKLGTDGTTKLPLASGSVTGIAITANGNTPQSVELEPITSGGAGTFSWAITLPADVATATAYASMTITPLDTTSGSPEQTLWLADASGTNTVTSATSLQLNSGAYRVALTLHNGAVTKTRTETLHVYPNMTSAYTENFTGVFTVTLVTSENDSGLGSLRKAIEDTLANGMICIADNVRTITLASQLVIDKNLIIEGNGVVITRDGNNYGLLQISSNTAVVNISRVHFKGSNGSINGSAIFLNQGTLTVESCIFSGNRSNYNGGAVYITDGNVTIKGCTFYGNSANNGGAISNGGTLTLTGNLFFGNTASSCQVVYTIGSSAETYSGGYNVVDVVYDQAGFTGARNNDKTIYSPTVLPTTFQLLSGSNAAGVITALLADYPMQDFNGDPITTGAGMAAAAGAVQSSMSANEYYYVEWSVNDLAKGGVAADTTPTTDGLYAAGTKLTATPTNNLYSFASWLVNGVRVTANPLLITGHAKIQAVFGRQVRVNSDDDGLNAETTNGTLRYALANANLLDGDIINIDPSVKTITLTSPLPRIEGSKSITINGNGVTLTQTGITPSTSSQLLNINTNAVVTISRVWFKDGRATSMGAAICNRGNLTLESCIFSGNQTTNSSAQGGAIWNNGTLTVNGCTFYQNSSGSQGGAINNGKTLTLTGNLFYGNTASSSSYGHVVYNASSSGVTVTSGGYNVVDVALGSQSYQSGFTPVNGDKNIGNAFSSLPVSGKSLKLLQDSQAANVITTLPEGYPRKDFYDNPINNGAAAGAVQAIVINGYYLDLSLNNSDMGIADVSTLNDDSIYSSPVTLTATPNSGDYLFAYWLVNDDKRTGSPLNLTLTGHTKVQAVFSHPVDVTSNADDGTLGTLRYALDSSRLQDGDLININIISGVNTITLTSPLPKITKGITIEGNGVTLTQTGFTPSNTSQLLYINSGTAVVNISRVWFKGGRTIGSNGAAIYNGGTLNLESCIFSDNQNTGSSNSNGGAIYSNRRLTVKGCTFYQNMSSGRGGAIYYEGTLLTLTGNLFYGNTGAASNRAPVVYNGNRVVTSGGYNVVDVALGNTNSQSGFAAVTGDKTFNLANGLGISGNPFTDVANGNFAPNPATASALYFVPSGVANFPVTDFNGQTRTWASGNEAPGAVK